MEHGGSASAFNREDAVVHLGVGKNMVRSIHYWMNAFGLLDEDGAVNSSFLNGLVLFQAPGDDNWDEFIEDPATLWLLHYAIVSRKYASLYSILYETFPAERPMLEFTVSSLTRFVQTYIQKEYEHLKNLSENSIKKDVQVLLALYGANKKSRNPEEDATGLFIHLDLIRSTGQVNEYGESTYVLNRTAEPKVPIEVFLYCLSIENRDKKQMDFDDIHRVAQLFGATFEGTEYLIDIIVQNRWGSYSSEAGIKNLRIYKNDLTSILKGSMLQSYYLS